MNQLQRDATYRLDALKSICEDHGYDSEACQQSIQIWESNHSSNVLSAKASFVGSVFLILILATILGVSLYSRFLKSKM